MTVYLTSYHHFTPLLHPALPCILTAPWGALNLFVEVCVCVCVCVCVGWWVHMCCYFSSFDESFFVGKAFVPEEIVT